MYEKIYEQVKAIPYGYVASYSSVAQSAGFFRGARIVGWALRRLPADSPIPWQRVVNKKGQVSIINPAVPASLQCQLLEREGNIIIEDGGMFVLSKPNWYTFNQEA